MHYWGGGGGGEGEGEGRERGKTGNRKLNLITDTESYAE